MWTTSYQRLKSGEEEVELRLLISDFCYSFTQEWKHGGFNGLSFLCFASGNGKLASWTSILGFVVMMSLDVGLG